MNVSARQAAGATLLSGVTSGTSYGQLVVSGNATVPSGASVGLTSLGYAFAAGQRYIVIDAAGTGTYNEGSLHYSAAGYTGSITAQNVSTGDHSDLVVTLSTPTSGPIRDERDFPVPRLRRKPRVGIEVP